MKKNRILIISIVLAIAFVACPIESTRNITAGIGFILGAVSAAWLGVRQRKGAQKEYEDTVRRYTGTTMTKVVWIEECGRILRSHSARPYYRKQAAKACFGWDVLLYVCRVPALVRYHVLCRYAFHFLILRTHAGSQQAHFSTQKLVCAARAAKNRILAAMLLFYLSMQAFLSQIVRVFGCILAFSILRNVFSKKA